LGLAFVRGKVARDVAFCGMFRPLCTERHIGLYRILGYRHDSEDPHLSDRSVREKDALASNQGWGQG